MSVSAILKSSVYCFLTFPQQLCSLWAASDRKHEKKSPSLLHVGASGQRWATRSICRNILSYFVYYFLFTFIKYEGILYWIFPDHLCQFETGDLNLFYWLFPPIWNESTQWEGHQNIKLLLSAFSVFSSQKLTWK